MPTRTIEISRWGGTTLEIVEVFRETVELVEGVFGRAARQDVQIWYPGGGRFPGTQDDLERKIRARYKIVERLTLHVWCGSDSFPENVPVIPPPEPREAVRWGAPAPFHEPLGVEIRLHAQEGVRLQVVAPDPGAIHAVVEEIEPLLRLGARAGWSAAVPAGIVCFGLTMLALLLFVVLGLGPKSDRTVLALSVVGCIALVSFATWATTAWAFPRLEITRDAERTRWERLQAYLLDYVGLTLGATGVILALALSH